MGVRFLLGRAGSGKSRRVFREIGEELRRDPGGPPLVLLVPEQMTQAADRAFATQFGGTVRAQSLSFRRLAFRVMQEVGGASRIHIDDTGKKMLLYKIARARAGSFRAFRHLAEGGGWIDAAHEWLAECKRYLVDAGQLQDRADSDFLPPVLRDKLHDLALLSAGMEEELAGHYVDSEDYLALLARLLPASQAIRQAHLWIDGFHGFTPMELTVLRQLFRHAAGVTVALTLDREYGEGETPDELELFHSTASTLLRLKLLCAEEGVPVEESLMLSSGEQRRNPALAALEQAFVDKANGRSFSPVTDPGEAVVLCAAANPRTEAEAAARDIVRAVVSGGVRWRDIAVFVRNWEGYGDVIAAVFEDYGIPFFLDQKRAVTHHPLSELVRSALDVVATRWSYDAVFRAIKTDLLIPGGTFGSESEARYAMDKLENVVLAYGIKGSRWTDGRRWSLNAGAPLEGEDAVRSERQRAEEERIHRWRLLVASPLHAFERRLAGAATMRELAEALYLFLEEAGVSATLERWREEAERSGAPERAKEHEQLWDRLMEMLDQLVELVGGEPADAELFSGMIAAGLESIRMGLVPPALDQVLVGNVDRTRTFGVKKLYLLGVNDGVFPMRPKDSGVITESERERLLASGMELAPDSRRRLLDERFLLYNAIFLPSESVWIGYSLSDPEGSALLPSEWIGILRQLSPGVKQLYMPADLQAGASEEEVLERLARPAQALSALMPQLRRWKRGEAVSGVWWAVYNWLSERPYWRERLQQLLSALDDGSRTAKLSAETAVQLYGANLRFSVSRLEKFAACPFAHFAAYGLRLNERRLYRLEAPDIGQLYHAALSQLAKRLAEEDRTWAEVSAEECAGLTDTVIEELAPRLMSEILYSSNRHKYVMHKLKLVVGRTADALRAQASRSGFRQKAAELVFGEGGEIPPLQFNLPGGAVMELQGRIDRIDAAQNEAGQWYIRVVDYKSRAHRLNLSDVYYGLSLQLLAYTDAAANGSPFWLGAESQIAGALYFHVHRPMLSLARAVDADTALSELFKKFKMNGLLLDDAEAARFMDTALEQGISPVVPLEWKKDGTLGARSKALEAAKWQSLRRFVRGKIVELGDDVIGGVVEAAPYRKKNETPCTFCQYKSVCGFDPELAGNAYRQLWPLTDQEVWERMERGGDVDG